MTAPADPAELENALRVLGAGGVVAAATETFFGLLADATSPRALDTLLDLKSRSTEKGMPLILPGPSAWLSWATAIPPAAERLADAFWPGPLTLALQAQPNMDPRLPLDGRIAVRVPASSPAAELARRFGSALTATSANLPGEPPATRPEDVRRAFHDVISAGRLCVVSSVAPGGAPSTVVIVDADALRIARVGAISEAQIAAVLGSADRL